jgi:diguanylate cyclase (GGDEF)-like protein
MKKKSPINFKRMFLFPTLITVLITAIFGFIIYAVASPKFTAAYQQMCEDYGVSYTNLVSKNSIIEKQLYDDLNKNLVIAANIVLAHRDRISNEYLQDVAEMSGVHYIWFYTPEGEIIYDSSLEFLGWKATPGDPIDTFMKSGLDVYLEGIRKSTEDDRHYMVVYKRDSDGYFVQIAIDADYAMSVLEDHSYANIVNEVVINNINVIYAYITDTAGIVVADTRSPGFLQRNMTDNLYDLISENTVSYEFYSEQLGASILEVASPVIIDGDIIAVMKIGYSLELLQSIKLYVTVILIIMSAAIIVCFLVAQNLNIVTPLRKLNTSITSFDINKGTYYRPTSKVSSINNLFDSLEDLSNKIKTSNEENAQLNLTIYKQAYNDFLTNIPNRLSFETTINKWLQDSGHFALIYLDVDDFTVYNDTKGHIYGDKILLEVAKKLTKIKDLYSCYIARYGGDEFVILYRYKMIAEVDNLCYRLIDLFHEPVKIDRSEHIMDISIGISLFPENGNNAIDLIRKADIAMYESQNKEKNTFLYFQNYMDAMLQEERRILEITRDALLTDKLKILLQPQYDLHTGEVVSFEALARIENCEIGPDRFIPVAEQSGLINNIGRVVVKKAIETLTLMKKKGFPLKPIYVNLSAMQFSDTSFLDYVLDFMYIYGIETQYLGFELTESALINREEYAEKFIQTVKAKDFKIAIDDFGSGYAGLSYLLKYPLEMVKLDRRFIKSYLNEEKFEVIDSIIKLSNLLGFTVLAEGVETLEQLTLLLRTNCKLVQGFYYSKPVEISEVMHKGFKYNIHKY